MTNTNAATGTPSRGNKPDLDDLRELNKLDATEREEMRRLVTQQQDFLWMTGAIV